MGESQPDNVLRLMPRDQVVADVQDWILRARLRPGDRLPASGDLARSLGVSATQVRQAVGALAAVGVLEPIAEGHTVRREPSTALDGLLRLRMSLSGFAAAELISIRLQLERAAATRAATAATPAEITRLRAAADATARRTVDHARFSELDYEFHLRLARAGHNGLAVLLISTLSDVLKTEMRTGYARSADWHRTAERLAAEHRSIVSAIQRRDSDRAAAEITTHLADFYDVQRR
jgi:DNA-binding FadR family transcriptional regulator